MAKTFAAILSELLTANGRFEEGRDVWAQHGHGRFRTWLLDGLNEAQRDHLDRDADTVGAWERLCETVFGDRRDALEDGERRATNAPSEPEKSATTPGWIASQAHMLFHRA